MMNVLSRARFGLGLGASAIWAGAAPAIAQSVATIRIGMPLTDAVTPILYANQTGMFKDARLDVQIVGGNSGASLAAAVAGGSLELGNSSLMPLIVGYRRGVLLPIVAGSTIFAPGGPTSEICVLKKSPFRSMGDLNGATIGTQALRSLDELAGRSLVDRNHGDSSTLKFVEIPFASMREAIGRERIDAASISEPNLALALDGGNLRSLGATFAGVGDGVLIAAFFCTPAYLVQNREVLDRFAATLSRATQYTNTHHSETVSLLAEYAHMDPSLVRRMTRATNATAIDLQKIQIAIDMAAKYKFIDHPFSAKELLA